MRKQTPKFGLKVLERSAMIVARSVLRKGGGVILRPYSTDCMNPDQVDPLHDEIFLLRSINLHIDVWYFSKSSGSVHFLKENPGFSLRGILCK